MMTAVNLSEMKVSSNPTETLVAFSIGSGIGVAVYDPVRLAAHAGALFGIGLACGLGEMFSAWLQGLIGAAACRCVSESEGANPLVFLIIAMGIVETVGLFSFILLWLMLPK